MSSFRRDLPEGLLAVEHDDDAVLIGRKALGQLAPRGDQHGSPIGSARCGAAPSAPARC
jgi:hypothetical protein